MKLTRILCLVMALVVGAPGVARAQATYADEAVPHASFFGFHLPRLGTFTGGLAGITAGVAGDFVRVERLSRPLVLSAIDSWQTSTWNGNLGAIEGFVQQHKILGQKAIFNNLSYAIAMDAGRAQAGASVADVLGLDQTKLLAKVAFYQAHPNVAEFGSGALWTQSNQSIASAAADGVQILERRDWLANNVRKLLGMAVGASFTAVNTTPRIEVHHVIPYAAPIARPARLVLMKWLLSIHDPANAVILPSTCHRGPNVHGQAGSAYERNIVFEFEDANDKARIAMTMAGDIEAGRLIILERLRSIGDNLSSSCGDAKSIPMQTALRVAERPLLRKPVNNYMDAPQFK